MIPGSADQPTAGPGPDLVASACAPSDPHGDHLGLSHRLHHRPVGIDLFRAFSRICPVFSTTRSASLPSGAARIPHLRAFRPFVRRRRRSSLQPKLLTTEGLWGRACRMAPALTEFRVRFEAEAPGRSAPRPSADRGGGDRRLRRGGRSCDAAVFAGQLRRMDRQCTPAGAADPVDIGHAMLAGGPGHRGPRPRPGRPRCHRHFRCLFGSEASNS